MNADLRYPVGKFEWPASVTPQQRQTAISEIAATPENMCTAVANLNDAQLDTPYRPEGWTVRQVVHHIADSHMNAYVRFRLTLTEDEPTIKPYLEARWAELPDARTSPVDVSLQLLETLHHRWVLLLRSMSDQEFARAYRHPEFPGRLLPLDTVALMYAWHGRHHVGHVTALRQRKGW